MKDNGGSWKCYGIVREKIEKCNVYFKFCVLVLWDYVM